MKTLNLANKYRPQRFAEVIGQPVSVKIMVNSVWYHKPRSMLLSGIRGTGKTTLARLYAKALNCEKFHELGDVCNECPSCLEGGHPLELDAASHSGADDARTLEGIIRQIPRYKYNVIILDECHMLSKQAQSVLLKVLEEAPAHSIFMLASTNPEKLLDTVRSRCLSMPLKTVSTADAAWGINMVLEAEGVAAEDGFVDFLALNCDGSLRDVYQLLEQLVISAGDEPLNEAMLEEAVGVISTAKYKDLAQVLCAKSYGVSEGLRVAFDEVDRWYRDGYDLQHIFMAGIPILLRDFTIRLSGCYQDGVRYLSGISDEGFASNLTVGMADVKRFTREWERTESMMRTTAHPRIIWEVFLIKSFADPGIEDRVALDY